MLELLILQNLLPKVVHVEYRKNKMIDRCFELEQDFLKPYRV